ncbi:MAG: glycosyltransferase family 1 protein [Nitrospiraceae bacterium]
MRILWINHRDPIHPEAGGAEVHIAEIGKRLVERGHEITLLAERFEGSKPEEEVYGMRVKRFGGKFTLHIYAPYFVRRKSKEFDVVIDDVAHAVPFWSPKFTRKPVVAIVHHVHQGVVEKELPPILSHLVKKAERSIRGTYENIIAVSQTTKKDLVELLGVEGSKIKVILHGVDHEKFRPASSKFKEPTVLCMGRMKRYKNLDHVVEAFGIVKKNVSKAKLIIVGAGDEESKARLLVQKKGLSDNVTFVGRISEEEKIALLQKAWCIVCASEVEGWGMGILEAAACGTTAVAYNSGALKESVINGETGLLASYGDVKELAKKLIEVLEDEGFMRKLSENALKYSFKFDWDKTVEQTEKYLGAFL